jgi:hypothetical protein
MEDRPMPPLRRKPSSPGPPAEPETRWTEDKIKAVLDAFRSFVGNAAKKHGVDPAEVAALVRDHLCDPDGEG